MLDLLGYPSLDALIDEAVPAQIRLRRPLQLPAARSEHEVLAALKEIASQNQVFRSYIGMGYHDCITPAVIQRNILENPGWYTPYTPYQAEIAQGRLEALLNFQTMVIDLTGLEVANASLLDEATAAAEAMTMCHGLKDGQKRLLRLGDCHPQTIDVVKTRAGALGIEVVVGDHQRLPLHRAGLRRAGAVSRTPTARSSTTPAFVRAGACGRRAGGGGGGLAEPHPAAAAGEFGADIAIGSAQRFGVPLGYGGPHAAYFATRDAFKRQMPGPHRRRLQGFPRPPRPAARAPNPRAAHPPREGHQQHLHRAGAAGQHGGHVRLLSRPGGLADRSPGAFIA